MVLSMRLRNCHEVRGGDLRSGDTTSCGCHRREVSAREGRLPDDMGVSRIS